MLATVEEGSSPSAWTMEKWQSKAACRFAPVEVFFPEGDGFEERAKEVIETWCAQCPVPGACLAFGKAQGAEGIWGGRLLGVRKQKRHAA